eukprot:1139089-Pelagomonas_calceolata.AAC.2
MEAYVKSNFPRIPHRGSLSVEGEALQRLQEPLWQKDRPSVPMPNHGASTPFVDLHNGCAHVHLFIGCSCACVYDYKNAHLLKGCYQQTRAVYDQRLRSYRLLYIWVRSEWVERGWLVGGVLDFFRSPLQTFSGLLLQKFKHIIGILGSSPTKLEVGTNLKLMRVGTLECKPWAKGGGVHGWESVPCAQGKPNRASRIVAVQGAQSGYGAEKTISMLASILWVPSRACMHGRLWQFCPITLLIEVPDEEYGGLAGGLGGVQTKTACASHHHLFWPPELGIDSLGLLTLPILVQGMGHVESRVNLRGPPQKIEFKPQLIRHLGCNLGLSSSSAQKSLTLDQAGQSKVAATCAGGIRLAAQAAAVCHAHSHQLDAQLNCADSTHSTTK